MEYMGQDVSGADVTGAIPAFGRSGTDGVQYADSGFLPDCAMPTDGGRRIYDSRPVDDNRLAESGQLTGGGRVPGDSGLLHTGRLAEISHFAEVSHLADGAGRPDGGWTMDENRFPDPSQLTEMSSLPGNSWLTDTSYPTDTGNPTDTDDLTDTSDPTGGGEFFPRGDFFPRGEGYRDHGGWYPDADGTYPAVDRYAGYERYAGERAGQDPEAAGERFLTRVYARPADPRQVQPQPDDPERPLLADHPAMSSLIRRLARLRLDRWLIAGGSLAAAVAVIVAFATAGGSAATPRSGTAQTGTTHAVQPACVSPATGR